MVERNIKTSLTRDLALDVAGRDDQKDYFY